MNTAPTTLSIVMPVFNAGEFLQEALDSIDANRFDGVEIETILVDDCSTDPQTLSLLEQVQQRPGIRLLRQARNGGPSKARNAGLKVATGEWVGFLDADDLLLPDSLRHRLEIAAQAPDAEWIVGDYLEMPIRGQTVHRAHHGSFNAAGRELGNQVRKIDEPLQPVAQGYPIFFGAMLIRRRLLERAGGIRDELIYAEDWHYSMVLASHTALYWTAQPLMCLRRHHESLTKNIRRAALENYKSELAIYRDPRFASIKKVIQWRLAGVLRFGAGQLLDIGCNKEALRLSSLALTATPTDRRCWQLFWKSLRKALYQ